MRLLNKNKNKCKKIYIEIKLLKNKYFYISFHYLEYTNINKNISKNYLMYLFTKY